ncbi:MAG: hypothetical protein ACE5H9_01455 [Anaerolineae bacterium]
MPTLREFLHQLDFITIDLSVLILFGTASLILLVRDWRLSIFALLIQYLATGLVLARIVRPEIALAKVLVGLLICPILYLSARQAGWSEVRAGPFRWSRLLSWRRTVSWEVFPAGRFFRLLAMLLAMFTAVTLSRAYPLAGAPAQATTIAYWLVAAGLLLLILTEEPFKAGQGLLTAITGFEVIYTTLERSLLLIGLWGAINLLLAVAIGYLTAVRGVPGEDNL